MKLQKITRGCLISEGDASPDLPDVKSAPRMAKHGNSTKTTPPIRLTPHDVRLPLERPGRHR